MNTNALKFQDGPLLVGRQCWCFREWRQ